MVSKDFMSRISYHLISFDTATPRDMRSLGLQTSHMFLDWFEKTKNSWILHERLQILPELLRYAFFTRILKNFVRILCEFYTNLTCFMQCVFTIHSCYTPKAMYPEALLYFFHFHLKTKLTV